MKTLQVSLVVLLCFLLSSCLQVEKVITVKPDGSGTVTETVMMSKAAVASMKQMAGAFTQGFGEGAAAPAAKPFEMLDEKKLREQAGKMGPGVSYVSGKKIANEKGEGYVATYAFTDINTVRIDQNPSSKMPETGGAGVTAKGGGKAEENLTFQFKKGAPAELIVRTPEQKPGTGTKKPEPNAQGNDEMGLQMAQQIMKDMKVVIAVEVAGNIVDTDAEHREGARVTLMEMAFNKLLANPEKLKAVSKASPDTLEETKALVKGVDGIKVETKNAVKIRFQ